jgi:hypothetical protein
MTPFADPTVELIHIAGLLETAALHLRALATTIPTRRVCAWCPDFSPTDVANQGATHVICPRCQARVNAALDAAERR